MVQLFSPSSSRSHQPGPRASRACATSWKIASPSRSASLRQRRGQRAPPLGGHAAEPPNTHLGQCCGVEPVDCVELRGDRALGGCLVHGPCRCREHVPVCRGEPREVRAGVGYRVGRPRRRVEHERRGLGVGPRPSSATRPGWRGEPNYRRLHDGPERGADLHGGVVPGAPARVYASRVGRRRAEHLLQCRTLVGARPGDEWPDHARGDRRGAEPGQVVGLEPGERRAEVAQHAHVALRFSEPALHLGRRASACQ